MKQFEKFVQQLTSEGSLRIGRIVVSKDWCQPGTVYSVKDAYDESRFWSCNDAHEAVGILLAVSYVADRDDFDLTYGGTHIAFSDDKEVLMQIAKQKQEQQLNEQGWASGAVITDNFTGEIVWELDERMSV